MPKIIMQQKYNKLMWQSNGIIRLQFAEALLF